MDPPPPRQCALLWKDFDRARSRGCTALIYIIWWSEIPLGINPCSYTRTDDGKWSVWKTWMQHWSAVFMTFWKRKSGFRWRYFLCQEVWRIRLKIDFFALFWLHKVVDCFSGCRHLTATLRRFVWKVLCFSHQSQFGCCESETVWSINIDGVYPTRLRSSLSFRVW